MPLYTFYKIVCKDENIKDCYVGKTKNLNKRIISHKNSYNNENGKDYNLKLYQFIRENGDWNNWYFIEIDKDEYDNEDSAIKERYWIEELNANLNCRIPSRTRKEYYQNNREKRNEQRKQYRENNIEKIKEKEKEYYQNNKERRREYYENNKKKLNENN